MKRAPAAVVFLLSAFACQAAEWAIEPKVEARTIVTDNINLTPNVHENVLGLSVTPRVTFARRTEVTEVKGTASLGFNRYPGNPELDADDVNLSLASQLREERSSYGLSASFVRDSTLESELATTGVVQERKQRNLVTMAPSWSYSLTQRSSIFAQYKYDQAHYESTSNLTDYSNQQASGGYQYAFSERTSGSLSGSYSRYETDTGSILTESRGVNFGLTHVSTERLTLNVGVGARTSETTITSTALLCEFGPVALCDFFGVPLQPRTETEAISDSGLSFNASADYRWEKTNAGISASRDLNPTGSGLLVQTDRLGIGIGHQLSERLTATADGSYLVSRYIGGVGNDTAYYRLDSNVLWKLDDWWTAGAGYSFAYQKVKDAPDHASANTIYLSISYNWPKISIGR